MNDQMMTQFITPFEKMSKIDNNIPMNGSYL